MTSSYLFKSWGLAELAKFISRDILFAFDLDGTLAPIVDDFSAARVNDPIRITLKRLANLAKVAVITGRSRKDAQNILGFEPHLLIGNHGAEWPPDECKRSWQFVECCLKWRAQLYDMLCDVQGLEFEYKGESIALHFRKAKDPKNVLSRIDAAVNMLVPSPRRVEGKFVVNLIPMDAFTKGEALIAAMEKFGADRAVYFGDDVTDEDIFQLKIVKVFGIHVGTKYQTAAAYYVQNQTEVLGLLNAIVGIIESTCGLKTELDINGTSLDTPITANCK